MQHDPTHISYDLEYTPSRYTRCMTPMLEPYTLPKLDQEQEAKDADECAICSEGWQVAEDGPFHGAEIERAIRSRPKGNEYRLLRWIGVDHVWSLRGRREV